MNKKKAICLIIVFVIAFAAIVGGSYLIAKKETKQNEPVETIETKDIVEADYGAAVLPKDGANAGN